MSAIEETLARIQRHRRQRQALAVLAVAGVLTIFWMGLQYLNFDLWELTDQLPTWYDWLAAFKTPNFQDFSLYSIENGLTGWSGLFDTIWYVITNPLAGFDMVMNSFTEGKETTLLGLSVVTVVIGVCGTILGFPFALLFGVLGSERVTPFPFNFLFRGVMSLIRAIPALVWILIYVPLAGISPVSAVLAVGTDTIGILGRLFTDELEEIEDGPIEAISSTGANRAQTVSFGMLSQVSTSFIAWTLYSLEINVRVAVSLGVVGAGGLGRYIQLKLSLLDYGPAAAGILMVVFIVLTVELTSSRLRARLRPGEEGGSSRSLLDAIRDLGDIRKWLGTKVERN
ncbi:phosphate ABC transporter permease [Halobacteriales archaeon QS_1_68_20]|nr:MAG: phosphate ABC transporter permease [Halobacteriales archaeon QS_1_68_20]